MRESYKNYSRTVILSVAEKQSNEMSKIQLYGLIASPPTRAIAMVCEIILVPYEIIHQEPGQKTPEFKKLNPQQQLPVLVDDGFVLSER